MSITDFIAADFIDSIVVREGNTSGVLLEKPLPMLAAEADVFGETVRYDGGQVTEAHFVYLSGRPSEELLSLRPDLFFGPFLVCMSREWEQFLLELPLEKLRMTRFMMRPEKTFSRLPDICLPEGYRLSLFDGKAYEQHPFGHGEHYPTYAEFAEKGAGAVAWYGEEIAASCSSFLTCGKDVEVDISTQPAHRKRGLAKACAVRMLQDCREKGLTAHWDAQNLMSRNLAEKLGFVFEQEYAVTMLKAPKTVPENK